MPAKNQLSRRSMLLASSIVSLQAGTSLAGDRSWPTWRGPMRDGTAEGAKWPASLDSLEQVWSLDLAESYSGPIIADGRVYTTETVGKESETLIALDAKSGDEIWKRQWKGAMTVPFFAASNGSWIRSTPATDGKHIVVGGMRDVVACFNCETGDELWRVDFAEGGEQLPSFGLVCSPLIDGEHVYIQAGGSVRKMLLADGSTVWEAMRDGGGMYGGAFSSPTIRTIAGKEQLVAQTRTTLCGIDTADGKVLWQRPVATFRGMNILTPTVWNDMVFTSCYGGKSQMIKPVPGSDSWEAELVWEGRSEAYMSSPVVVGDHVYMHLKNNRVSCINLADGKEAWRTTPMGKYWSMVTNGDKIVALADDGKLMLINPTPEKFELIGEKDIADEPTWAHLAILDNHVYVRRLKGLDCYRWE